MLYTTVLKKQLSLMLVMLTFQVSAIAALDNSAVVTAPSIKVQSSVVKIGYQIGDIAHQTITVDTPNGYVLDTNSLPTQGKNASYMELRDVKWHTTTTNNSSQHILTLDWQIFRVMQETRAYSLRPLDIRFRLQSKNDTEKQPVLTAHVNADQLLVASILPTTMDVDYMRPFGDVSAPIRQTSPLFITLLISIISFLLSCAYVAWRYDWLPARLVAFFAPAKPFKCAYREIKLLQKTKGSPHQINNAMRSLHRAFNLAAGTTVSTESVSILFNRHKNLLAKQIEIEHFFAESEQVFFAGGESNFSLKQLLTLSYQLMLLE